MNFFNFEKFAGISPIFVATVFLATLQFGTNFVDAAGSNATTIGHCLFYGDKKIECRGRLRCKPADFQTSPASGSNGEQQQLPELEQVCPGVDEFANGTWSLAQGIIPSEYANVIYPNEVVAKCHFRTNGSFYCAGGPVWREAFWEGFFSGSLNSAFELGLDRWYFQSVHRTNQLSTTTTTIIPVAETRGRWPSVTGTDQERDERWRQAQAGNDNNVDIDSYPSRQSELPNNGNDNNSNNRNGGRGSAADNDQQHEVSGTRDEVNRFDAQRAADLDAEVGQSSVTYTIAPRRVFVCEYYNNGQVGCRNCTEKMHRVVLESGENGNRRDYNCSQPKNGPVLKRWNADNGIIPMSPDSTARVREVVATCIFEKSTLTYECHGQSALCPDDSGNRVHTNKCLGGKRWSGDYTGDFGYLV